MVLKAIGNGYSKIHEVPDFFLRLSSFPDWFKVEIDFLHETSKLLFKKREPIWK